MSYILVIGACLMDTKGKPHAGLDPGTSNPADIKTTLGGTARNVAENLARLGAEVKLISAVGDDMIGRQLVRKTAASGVDTTHVQVIEGANTGSYIALLDASGGLSVALDDTRVMANITPNWIYQNRILIRDAAIVMVDGGVTSATLETIVNQANKMNVPMCADPSSIRLATRLCPILDKLNLVVPNELEAAAICGSDYQGFDPDSSLSLARELVRKGVDTAVVTLSDFGLVYATGDESGYLPVHATRAVDSTGTGDAITAAILFGILEGLPTLECMKLGVAAAGMTLQTADSVYQDISLDELYNHLVV
ncbi:MAG: pseudouridine kinase [Candidatus Promineifilaceae bacterium]|jgi:pseudouridine kinase